MTPSDRIELGHVAVTPTGLIVEALSVDEQWHFTCDGDTWTADHLPSGRVLTHAGSSLEMARASERRLLAELELVYGRLNARDRLVVAGICPCDPTHGQSCVQCDGTAAELNGDAA